MNHCKLEKLKRALRLWDPVFPTLNHLYRGLKSTYFEADHVGGLRGFRIQSLVVQGRRLTVEGSGVIGFCGLGASGRRLM